MVWSVNSCEQIDFNDTELNRQKWGFSLTHISLYKDNIVDSVLIRENGSQWKIPFLHTLRNESHQWSPLSIQNHYIFTHFTDHKIIENQRFCRSITISVTMLLKNSKELLICFSQDLIFDIYQNSNNTNII